MKGTMILILGLLLQIGLFVWCLHAKDIQIKLRVKIDTIVFLILNLAFLLKFLQWGFRYYVLYLFLIIYLLVSLLKQRYGRKPAKPFRSRSAVGALIKGCFMTLFLLIPMLLFPEY